jgi:limonene-1,2-epoxide hydrolase
MKHDSERGNVEANGAAVLVREYFKAVGPTSEDFWRSFHTYFDENTIWENVGVSRTIGRDAAIEFARAFPIKFDHMRIEGLSLSSTENRVYVERMDHFCTHEGGIVASIRALGVFEISGRKIAHWRDYFDTAGFGASIAAGATR